MKKLGIAVLGVLVATGLFFVFTAQKSSEVEVLDNTVEKGEKIALFRESGDVFYTNPGAMEVKLDDLTPKAEVYSGSEVRTLEGSAYVLFPDNSMMSIDKNTTVIIEYTKEKVSILQTLGNTYHRVKTLESGQEYEVRTPGTLAAVRGTKFAVLFDKATKKSNVKVTESKVQVKKLDTTKPFNEPPVVIEEVTVPEGSQVDVPDVRIQTTRPLALVKMERKDIADTGWMERNELVDRATQNPEMRREFIEKMMERAKEEKGLTDKEKIEKLRERVREFMEEKGIENDPATLQDDGKVLVAKVPLDTTPDTQPTLLKEVPPVTPPVDEENLPPLDPSTSDSNDPFVLEFDRRYEYWFPIYSDKALLCSRVNPLTPEILRARLLAFETNYKGVVPNKDGILAFLRVVKTYCASTDTDNRVLDEGYTEAYPF